MRKREERRGRGGGEEGFVERVRRLGGASRGGGEVRRSGCMFC